MGPGDVWVGATVEFLWSWGLRESMEIEVFSGGQPHTAMCVGDGINICAYELGPSGATLVLMMWGLAVDKGGGVTLRHAIVMFVSTWLRICMS